MRFYVNRHPLVIIPVGYIHHMKEVIILLLPYWFLLIGLERYSSQRIILSM